MSQVELSYPFCCVHLCSFLCFSLGAPSPLVLPFPFCTSLRSLAPCCLFVFTLENLEAIRIYDRSFPSHFLSFLSLFNSFPLFVSVLWPVSYPELSVLDFTVIRCQRSRKEEGLALIKICTRVLFGVQF